MPQKPFHLPFKSYGQCLFFFLNVTFIFDLDLDLGICVVIFSFLHYRRVKNFVMRQRNNIFVNYLPNDKILDSSKMKHFADNFRFDENGGKISKRVENTVGIEKLLVLSNFSFSHGVFERLVLQTCKNQGLFGKGLTLYQTTNFCVRPHSKYLQTTNQIFCL